jgi:hypothetical protein
VVRDLPGFADGPGTGIHFHSHGKNGTENVIQIASVILITSVRYLNPLAMPSMSKRIAGLLAVPTPAQDRQSGRRSHLLVLILVPVEDIQSVKYE